MHGAGKPVLVKAVTQMCAAEPGVARALHCLNARLRRNSGMIEDGMFEFMGVENQLRRDSPFSD